MARPPGGALPHIHNVKELRQTSRRPFLAALYPLCGWLENCAKAVIMQPQRAFYPQV
jgi:hypothetical protein